MLFMNSSFWQKYLMGGNTEGWSFGKGQNNKSYWWQGIGVCV
jgi:hypothetical protein